MHFSGIGYWGNYIRLPVYRGNNQVYLDEKTKSLF